MEILIDFFHKLYHFEELIKWGGHFVLVLIVFVETGIMAGFFLPGDSLLVTAGLLASSGTLNVWVLLIELCIAAIAGDSLNYYIGRKLGVALFTKEDSLFFNKKHLMRAQAFYEKHGGKAIVMARFVPIIRTFAPTVAGMGNMNYSRFLFYNIAGGVAWVFSMVLLGYSLGKTIPNIEDHVHKVIFIVIFLSFIPIILEFVKSRSKQIPS